MITLARYAELLSVYEWHGEPYLCFRVDSESRKPAFVSRRGNVVELYMETLRFIGGSGSWKEYALKEAGQ
jgi:hypothetical protein